MKIKGRKQGRLKSVLTGAASALNLYGSTRSISSIQHRIADLNNTFKSGRHTDGDNLSQDWYNIGSDIRSAYNKTYRYDVCE